MITSDLKKAADIAVLRCMGVKAGESVLIVVDTPQRDFGPLFASSCLAAGAEPLIIEMTPRESHGEEPPESVARAMLGADVVIMPTSKSLSHTAARLAATRAGARIASLPTITPEVMGRTLVADYDEIERRNGRLLGVLGGKSRVRLSSPAGTDLTFSIEGRTFRADGGINHRPGDFANLPAGEVYAAPVEGTATGLLVVDGSMAGVGLLADPIELVVTDGSVVEIRGGEEAEELERLITPFGWDARNVAELGIGTNETATVSGNVLEDEKVLGTCHVALGDNSTFGGTVSVASHLDGIVREPTLEADGVTVLEGGKPVGW
jgi:leucyl aminopeptidase (aminopeptidase T)